MKETQGAVLALTSVLKKDFSLNTDIRYLEQQARLALMHFEPKSVEDNVDEALLTQFLAKLGPAMKKAPNAPYPLTTQ